MTDDLTEKFDNLIIPLEERHQDYLKDESRSSGTAESISFPENQAQVQAIVKRLLKRQTPITVQGSRTGLAGGAVPGGGHILNLSRMTRVLGLERDQAGRFHVRVQPGITLSQLDEHLSSRVFDCEGWDLDARKALEAFQKAARQFWPPDPSEQSASVGGIAANNSRGICALHYGPARDHIKGICVVDTQGEIQSPPAPMDLYLGTEGMFGAITELTLALQPLPCEQWGIVFFFETQSQALDFISAIEEHQTRESPSHIAAIEFMDQTTLACIREYKQVNPGLKIIPDWDARMASAVYLEIHGHNTRQVEALADWLLETALHHGNDPDDTWAFSGEMEIERVRLFRSAAPEAVNHLIDRARQKDSRITKLGTDMRLQTSCLADLLDMYGQGLAAYGLKAAIFGHAADRHLHVNILPLDYQQYMAGKTLIQEWATRIYAKGGSIVTEHGVGKLKKELFRSHPLSQHLKPIGSLKQQLDPKGLWNPGNMMDSP